MIKFQGVNNDINFVIIGYAYLFNLALSEYNERKEYRNMMPNTLDISDPIDVHIYDIASRMYK